MTQRKIAAARQEKMRPWVAIVGVVAILGTFAEADWPLPLRIASGVAVMIGPGAAVLRVMRLDETLDAALVVALSFVVTVAIIVLPTRLLMETGSLFAFDPVAVAVIGSTAAALSIDAIRFLLHGLPSARRGGWIQLRLPTTSTLLCVGTAAFLGVVALGVALFSPSSSGGPMIALADPVNARSAVAAGDDVGVVISAVGESLDQFTLSVTVDSRSAYETEGSLAADEERLYTVPTADAGPAAEKIEIRLFASNEAVRTLRLLAD